MALLSANQPAIGLPEDATGPAAPGVAMRPTYPNPFNPATTIPFFLAREAPVALRVYDATATGALVRILIEGRMGAGAHRLPWDGTGASGARLPASVYFYELRAGDEVRTGKMALVE